MIKLLKINEFLDCVVNYTSENISECDRAFRIIYWFVHTIAELGYGNFDYSMLDDHSVYITYLQVVEKEMFRLLAKFPDTDPNNDYNRLKIVFNRLCNIGYT